MSVELNAYPLKVVTSPCATADNVENIGLANLNSTEENGAESRLVTCQNGAEARLVTAENGSEARLVTNQNGMQTRDAIHWNGMESRLTEQHTSSNILEQVRDFGLYLGQKVDFFGLKNLEATKDSSKDIMMQACENVKDVLMSQMQGFKEVEVQAANNKACLELQAAKNTADLQMTATINAKDAAMTACINKSDLEKQIAECCCENKTMILEQTNQIEKLMLKLDETRVRDELQKTRTELEILKLRATLLPTLVPAVSV